MELAELERKPVPGGEPYNRLTDQPTIRLHSVVRVRHDEREPPLGGHGVQQVQERDRVRTTRDGHDGRAWPSEEPGAPELLAEAVEQRRHELMIDGPLTSCTTRAERPSLRPCRPHRAATTSARSRAATERCAVSTCGRSAGSRRPWRVSCPPRVNVACGCSTWERGPDATWLRSVRRCRSSGSRSRGRSGPTRAPRCSSASPASP